MGPITPEILRDTFELRGEDVFRKRSGKLVVNNAKSYGNVCIGRKLSIGYHRLKFFLHHGWLPEMVDHEDGNTANGLLGNLRPATRPQNMRNQPRVLSRRDLPRGVYRRANGRLRAKYWDGKKYHVLGRFDDPVEASCLVEAKLKELHGEFYVKP
jgi:hypothetical protein